MLHCSLPYYHHLSLSFLCFGSLSFIHFKTWLLALLPLKHGLVSFCWLYNAFTSTHKSSTVKEAFFRLSHILTMIYFCTFIERSKRRRLCSTCSQSPDLIGPVQSGSCVTHVFLTSGDAGLGNDYPESREAGNEASYAYMAGVTDSWTEYNATFAGQPVLIRTLAGRPNIQRVWFRLPDGGLDGSGFGSSGGQSLLKLYYGSISTISDRYGLATYSLSDLVTALGQIIVSLQPSQIHTLDYLSDYGTGDHSDHQTIARIVAAIPGGLGLSTPVSGYMAYPASVNYAPNLNAGQIQAKSDAFFVYTREQFSSDVSFQS